MRNVGLAHLVQVSYGYVLCGAGLYSLSFAQPALTWLKESVDNMLEFNDSEFGSVKT